MPKKDKNIPLLDCPVEFLCGDASGKVLNEYARFPCRIKCGVFALIVRGTAYATINITKFKFEKNDFISLDANSYLLVHDFSEDALVYYIIFSSNFLNTYTNLPQMSLTALQLRQPIVHLQDEQAKIYLDAAKLLIRAMEASTPFKSLQILHIYNLIYQSFLANVQSDDAYLLKPKDRSSLLYQEYCQLVLKMHTKWHKVSEYADAMCISLPHLSSTINKVCKKTASDLITDAIMTDAKFQLKMSNIPIKEIAIELGFEDVGVFCRFFKTNEGKTPKQYRLE